MATALLDRTDLPVAPVGLVAPPTRLAIQRRRTGTGLSDSARCHVLAELAAVPASRRRLLALADAVRRGSAPAAALIEGPENAGPDAADVLAVLRSFADIRRLDRQIEVLRMRASGSRRAAEIVAWRRESARLSDAVAALLSTLPIRRRLVRTLATELLTLADRSERAGRALAGPADADRIHAVERQVGLRVDSFHQRCARLREADRCLRAAEEQDQIETPMVLEKGSELCVSGKR
jgi:hypothetical protein